MAPATASTIQTTITATALHTKSHFNRTPVVLTALSWLPQPRTSPSRVAVSS
ncbi:hypothetical protein [Thermoleptolyngbya sp. C42_A2020_037]|uniref:hypothetical protein n=1 Tax=Thermoleptolyngbya sp. C42_A2020_037 TaxID=2747799 RepID=UPI0019DD18DD|nr:hypothetical protein [Thermoleptolyngbya sp. C42_A2020_037]MBF2086316.1 hypothetical protein [Thermoleptolyngbya sp. C42_A2020_037]